MGSGLGRREECGLKFLLREMVGRGWTLMCREQLKPQAGQWLWWPPLLSSRVHCPETTAGSPSVHRLTSMGDIPAHVNTGVALVVPGAASVELLCSVVALEIGAHGTLPRLWPPQSLSS